MKLLFVGDPHLDTMTPLSRIDNYRELTIQKLNSILRVALEKEVSDVIMLGDMFDKLDQSLIYMHEVINSLTKYKEANITVWSLIGNHDLKHNNIELSQNTPLSLLFKSGLVKHLVEEHFEGTSLYGIDFTKAELVDKIKVNPENYSIISLHYATDNTIPNESIPLTKLEQFDMAIFGHDHNYYKPKAHNKKTIVLRPGSLTRRTKDNYNLNRDIIVYLVDTVERTLAEIKLPNVLPAEEVFRHESFLEPTTNLYKLGYDNIFTEDFYKTKATDLITLIESLPSTVTKESLKLIKDYFKKEGLITNE